MTVMKTNMMQYSYWFSTLINISSCELYKFWLIFSFYLQSRVFPIIYFIFVKTVANRSNGDTYCVSPPSQVHSLALPLVTWHIPCLRRARAKFLLPQPLRRWVIMSRVQSPSTVDFPPPPAPMHDLFFSLRSLTNFFFLSSPKKLLSTNYWSVRLHCCVFFLARLRICFFVSPLLLEVLSCDFAPW